MATPQPKIGQNLTGTFEKTQPTPASDVYLRAILSNNVADYIQTLYGTPPPENTDPAYMLVNEVPVDWQLVKRLYVTDRQNEDTYNASISYDEEASAYPIFTRDYYVRRANYTPKTPLTALPGLVNAAVTAGGTGYDQSTVSVSLSGGTGSGGAVTAIVSNGAVVHLVIAAEGNYTVAPTLTIHGGTGATGTAFVQPQAAVLTKEEMIRQPDSELDGLYVLVRRTFQTIPGPITTGYRLDEHTGDTIVWTKQLVLATTAGSGTNSSGGYVTIDPVNSLVAWKRTDFTVGADLVNGRAWTEDRFVDLPRVLTYFNAQVWDDTDGNIIAVTFQKTLTNYSNYYAVSVSEKWSRTPQNIQGPTPLTPQGFSWATPFGGDGVQECLHADVTISGSIPADVVPAGFGRFYGAATWNYFFSATSPADLAGAVIVLHESNTPYAGGFLYRAESIRV